MPTATTTQTGPIPLRRQLYEQLEPGARDRPGLSMLNRLLVGVILAATALAIIETEKSLPAAAGVLFGFFERVFGCLFVVEYLARIWIAPERGASDAAFRERLRVVFSVSGAIDVIVIVASFAPIAAGGAVFLRWLRVARILRLTKLGRMSRALDHIILAIHSRRHELGLTVMAGFALIVVAATALYLAEGSVQPDKFGSIPRALWWAVATMTTIGYGDVYPITPLGKLLAGVTALLSIGLIAMPTGILAAAFSDGLERHRRGNQDKF